MTELGSQRGGGQAFSLLNNCTPPRNGQRTCENVSDCSFPGGKKKKKTSISNDGCTEICKLSGSTSFTDWVRSDCLM